MIEAIFVIKRMSTEAMTLRKKNIKKIIEDLKKKNTIKMSIEETIEKLKIKKMKKNYMKTLLKDVIQF